MTNKTVFIKKAAQVVTPLGHKAAFGEAMKCLKIYENCSVFIEDGVIAAVGTDIAVPAGLLPQQVIEGAGKAVLPGFIDSHTHFIFGGYRAEEFSWRLRGDSYMDIMNRGGGIVNTVRDTRGASLEELVDLGRERLDSMLSFGVTTVEGKSGYGLDRDTEFKQLEAMTVLNEEHPIDIVKTFLGAHAVPLEYKGRTAEYIDFMLQDVLPVVAQKKMADYCDVFCEKGVFSVEESRKILRAAKKLGMKLKIHADEIVNFGGGELAAELGAESGDHLLHVSNVGIKKMAEQGVISTLLPTTAFCLHEPYAPAREIIDAGGAVALATDFNPGSGFTNSVPLMFALAAIYMNMSIEEAITALTLNGAAAVGRADTVGTIETGKKGDVVLLKFPSYKYLPYHTGVNIVETVIKNGLVVYHQ